MRIKRENKSFRRQFSDMGHVKGQAILEKVTLIMGRGI